MSWYFDNINFWSILLDFSNYQQLTQNKHKLRNYFPSISCQASKTHLPLHNQALNSFWLRKYNAVGIGRSMVKNVWIAVHATIVLVNWQFAWANLGSLEMIVMMIIILVIDRLIGEVVEPPIE